MNMKFELEYLFHEYCSMIGRLFILHLGLGLISFHVTSSLIVISELIQLGVSGYCVLPSFNN